MQKRKEINDSLAAWILNKVKTEYADDISLVLLYGSYINGTAGSKSDLDCYFIPKNQRGYDLAVTFIIEGVGYDLFPIPWERAERIADLQDAMSPLVGDVEVLYCNCPEDANRLQALQERLKRNLSNEDYVREIAVKRCRKAGSLCSLLDRKRSTAEVRKLAGQIIMTLADAVAVRNRNYFHRGLKKQFEDLQHTFPDVPRTIVTDYQNVVEAGSIDDVIRHAKKMFVDVCEYLNVSCASQELPEEESFTNNKINAACLAGLYEEICSTFNKIYVCCEARNHILAFLSAVCLQQELDDAKEAGCPDYDLLGEFNHTDLRRLADTARRIERELVSLIRDNGGDIRDYDSFEAFASANL